MTAPQEPIPTNVHCQKCGYNLTGVAIGGRCPECGAPVVPLYNALERPTSGFALASIILGVVSIPGCMCYGVLGIVCGSLGLVFGILADKQIATGNYADGSKTIALIGKVCGAVGLAMSLLLIAIYAVLIIVAMSK